MPCDGGAGGVGGSVIPKMAEAPSSMAFCPCGELEEGGMAVMKEMTESIDELPPPPNMQQRSTSQPSVMTRE